MLPAACIEINPLADVIPHHESLRAPYTFAFFQLSSLILASGLHPGAADGAKIGPISGLHGIAKVISAKIVSAYHARPCGNALMRPYQASPG